MPNDPIQEPDSDDYRINPYDSWQMLWWCQYFGLTKTELETVIKETGTNVDDVQCYLAHRSAA